MNNFQPICCPWNVYTTFYLLFLVWNLSPQSCGIISSSWFFFLVWKMHYMLSFSEKEQADYVVGSIPILAIHGTEVDSLYLFISTSVSWLFFTFVFSSVLYIILTIIQQWGPMCLAGMSQIRCATSLSATSISFPCLICCSASTPCPVLPDKAAALFFASHSMLSTWSDALLFGPCSICHMAISLPITVCQTQRLSMTLVAPLCDTCGTPLVGHPCSTVWLVAMIYS